jgi:hypothetical protein
MMNAKRIPSQHPQARRAARPVRRITAHRRAPRGSVLILVVSLLVLMALIGTAWISTTRVDRANTFQNTHNTQVDLLIEGVANTVKARLIDDLFNQGVYRQAGGKYDHSDSVVSDEFLASRVPVLRDEVASYWHAGIAGTATTPPVPPPVYLKGRYVQYNNRFYVCLQDHLAESGRAPGNGTFWDEVSNTFDVNTPFDPNNPPVYGAVSRVLLPGVQFEDISGKYPAWTDRIVVTPVAWLDSSTPGRPQPKYPGLSFYHTGVNAMIDQVIAGDTDGDGAADAFLYRLPVGRLNGLDYFAAVRVVDNNSAVNAATALGAATPGAVAAFPSSINLISLITGPNARDVRDQLIRLNRMRLTADPRDDLSVTPFNFPPSDAPLSDQFDTVANRRRGDFAYGSVEELMYFQLIRRMANPGEWTDGDNNPQRLKALPASDLAALLFRGGTLLNPDSMNADLSPSTMLERILGSTLYYSAANHPSASTDMARQPAYPLSDPMTIMKWFGRNFDYRQLWTRELQNDPITYRDRRALMTAFNPVSSAIPFRYRIDNPRWVADFYDVGQRVVLTRQGRTVHFVCINPQVRNGGREPFLTPPQTGRGSEYSHPTRLRGWEPQVFEGHPTKVSANSGSFGRLFLAFWQAMGERPTFAGGSLPNTVLETPFKDALHYLITRPGTPLSFHDPYIGRHFTAGAIGAAAPVFPASGPLPPGNPAQIEHPLRMFASPIRAVPAAAGDPWDDTTPRLMQDETMRLRAALAAVNAMDMRDNDHDVTYQDVTLRVSLDTGANEALEAHAGDIAVFARARVYGHEPQPFLTEVFAHTDNESTGPGGAPAANTYGYVAIELYNPHPFPIDIVNCRLATIDRRSGTVGVPAGRLTVTDPITTPALAPNLAGAVSNLLGGAAFMPATVIPAKGYLVLENFSAGPPPAGGTAVPPAFYRPPSTGMPLVGEMPNPDPDLAPATPMRNYAYVPNLHTVMDKEMVLLRPLSVEDVNDDPSEFELPVITIGDEDDIPVVRYAPRAVEPVVPVPAVDMAPLDSFDFTGLPNPDPAIPPLTPIVPVPTQKFAWHYVRPSGAGKEWRFVYPGRYDASQSVPVGTAMPRPRHQGTLEAAFPEDVAGGIPAALGWNTDGAAPYNTDPWAPTSPFIANRPQPRPTLAVPSLVPGAPDIPDASYGVLNEHPIQLTTNLNAYTGAAGPYSVGWGGPNQYPFGGFARNGDILNVPFIGSYRIKLTQWTLAGTQYTTIDEQVVEPGDADYNLIFELNAITMDSSMAEDTDPDNYPRTGDAPGVNEQIGRFAPSIPDLMPERIGTVDNVGGDPMGSTVDDNDRAQDPDDAADRWTGYEMEIIAGTGKGQVRQVFDYAGGTFTLFRAWDFPLGPDSVYALRKGSLWNIIGNGMPPGQVAPDYYGAGAYKWADDVLEYLTVDLPQDDHFPPADPLTYGNVDNDPPPPMGVNNSNLIMPASVTYGRKVSGSGKRFTATDNLVNREFFYKDAAIEFLTGPAVGQVHIIQAYTGGNRGITVWDNFPPDPVTGESTEPLEGDVFRILPTPDPETVTPVHGLININTAPWPVLATLPMIPENLADNATLAQEICRWRDGDPSAGVGANGPFKSVFDLYKVPQFTYAQAGLLAGLGDVEDGGGDFTPQGAGTDGVLHDHEENYLLANRISNMVTTRSDTFTCYVLVQGWRGAGTANPELVVQRRRAFVADRTGVTQGLREVPLQYFYNE